MVDYTAFKLRRMGVKITYSKQCRTGLYSAPSRVIRYLGMWMSSSEEQILKETYAMLEWDMKVKRSCGIPVKDVSLYFNNYRSCVRNVVDLAYRNVAIRREVMNETPLNTGKLTGNVRSYLKSVLAMKVNCAPKGQYAYNYKFANQDQCLRDVVGINQAKYMVRYSLGKGDFYNALMGMSGVFKNFAKSQIACRLQR